MQGLFGKTSSSCAGLSCFWGFWLWRFTKTKSCGLTKYCDALTIVFAFIAMIFAFRKFISAQKGEQIIGIFIEKNGQKESLPLVILRKNFTRAELFGALQTINQREKFNIAYLKTMDFFENLSQIQAKKSNELIIKLSPNDSFDFDKNAAV